MRRQRGVALLAAVLVVALATLLIAGLLDRGSLGQARALQFTRAAQAHAYQQGLELWAARILRDDLERDRVDSRTDAWAQAMPPVTVPDGLIHGRMRDLDGCLNLNGLVQGGQADPLAVARFTRLLRVLELDPALVDQVLAWTSPAGAGAGTQDAAYAALDPPRRTARAPFAHVSGLRAVIGVDEEIYQRLLPHVCTRPDPASPINLNTATPEVLRSLHDGIGPALAQRLHADGRARFLTPEEFFERLLHDEAVPILPPDRQGLATASRYFVAQAEISISQVPVRLYSLLEREPEGRVTVHARSQGRF